MLKEFEAYMVGQAVQTVGAEVASREVTKGVHHPVTVPECMYLAPRVEVNAT